MPIAIFHGVGPARPRYTESVSLKAADPVWKPEISQAHPRPLCDFGAFFASKFPSMAGRVGQPQGWPVPVAGTSTPPRPVALRFVEEAATVPSTTQEPPMNAFVLSGFTSAEASAIARAALGTYIDQNPSFGEEISYRLLRLAEVFDLLETLTSEAGFHGFDVPAQSLYGIVALANRELKMIDALNDAQFRITQGAKP